MTVGPSNGLTVCKSQVHSVCAVLLIALFAIVWWNEAGWGQTLSLENGSTISSVNFSQTRELVGIQSPSTTIFSLNSNLNLNFLISNFADGTFNMDLVNDGDLSSISTFLGLSIALSEHTNMNLDFFSAGFFSQGKITPDDLSTSFSVDLDLDLDSLDVSLDAQLASSTDPADPTDDENIAALAFELKANAGKGRFSLHVDLENSVFPLDPDENKTDLDIKAKASGNLDPVKVIGETKLNRNFEQDKNDPIGDKNKDGCPGTCGVDDDKDGLTDEDTQGREPGDPGYTNNLVNDDDEDGRADELTVETDFSNELETSIKVNSKLLSFDASATLSQEGELEDPTKTKQQTLVEASTTFSLDTISVRVALSQDHEQFPLKPNQNSNTLNTSLNVAIEIDAILIFGTMRNTQEIFPNNLVGNQKSSETFLMVSLPISETIFLDITLINLNKTSFPNDPSIIDDITDIKSISLTFNLDFINVGLSFDRVEFPLDPEKNTMSANVLSLFSFCVPVTVPAFMTTEGFSCNDRIESFFFQFDLGTNLSISPEASNSELFLTFSSEF